MFYSKFMFVKKGPLAKVWLAAHFHRKLNKQMVQGTDINLSCKSILEPQAPLALRLTGQLLLGLVRIYQKKVKYLQEDCSDALTKMKSVFRAGAVDLPPESAVAASGAITHPDNYDEIEYAIPDIPMENFDEMMADVIAEGGAISSANAINIDYSVTNAREITLDDFTNEPLPDNLGMMNPYEDDLIPFEEDTKVSEAELPRGSQDVGEFAVQTPGERPDDLTSDAGASRASRKSVLPADMSGFDTTTDADLEAIERASVVSDRLGGDVDVPATPIPPIAPIEVEIEKKVKPKRKLRRDARTELPSSVIGDSLKDTKDIRLVEGRPSIPFTKRAKLRDAVHKTNLAQLMKQPSGFAAVFSGTIQAESQLNIAPELWGIVEQAESLARPAEPSESQMQDEDREQEITDAKAEEEPPVEPEEQPVPEFEGGDLGSLIDDTSTIGGDRSTVAPTPGPQSVAEPEEPEREVPEAEEREVPEAEERDVPPSYRDDSEHFRQELTEFFGEDKPKKRGKKGETEAEEEEVAALGWGHRTDKMHQVLVNKMKGKTSVDFDTLVGGRSRTIAAGVFYQLLVLKSHSIIQVSQERPYENIVISELKRTARAS